jgi:hypothetical protein
MVRGRERKGKDAPEIADLEVAVRVEEQIRRLEVAVENAAACRLLSDDSG